MKLRQIALVGSFLILLAGCGNDSPINPPTTTGGTTPTTGVTSKPEPVVKVCAAPTTRTAAGAMASSSSASRSAAAVGELHHAQPVARGEQAHRLGIDRDGGAGGEQVGGDVFFVQVDGHPRRPSDLRSWLQPGSCGGARRG